MEETKLVKYRNELMRIQHLKELTAQNVLEEAKNTASPLHEYFDWNNTSAGEKWRLHQARLLINYIIEPQADEGANKVYSYEFVEGSYKHVDAIMTNEDWKSYIATQAIGQLKYWKIKYERYKISQFTPVIQEISRLLDENDEEQTRRRQSAPST